MFQAKEICVITSALNIFNTTPRCQRPGRVAQSVGHLTRKSEVLGSIFGLATYYRSSFR